MAHGFRSPHFASRTAVLRKNAPSTLPMRSGARTLWVAAGVLAVLWSVSAAHAQNGFTRVYGPEDQAVPMPAFIGTQGQQDASAVQEIAAYRATVSPTEWKGLTAAGTLTDAFGNPNQANLTIVGGDQFRLDVTTPKGERSTRTSGPYGAQQEENGKIFLIPPVTARAGLLPFSRLLISTFPGPKAIIVDRGQVELDGTVLHRITLEAQTLPSSTTTTQNFNVTDLYFAPGSHLLIKSASSVQLNPADRERYLIVVTYGDYQSIDGAPVPLTFTETLNGQPQWVLQLGNPNLQPAVDASYFHF